MIFAQGAVKVNTVTLTPHCVGWISCTLIKKKKISLTLLLKHFFLDSVLKFYFVLFYLSLYLSLCQSFILFYFISLQDGVPVSCAMNNLFDCIF